MSLESQENLEEERRLFYVALTRAKKRLFLSFATTRFKWGQFIDSKPSRFISEIDENYLEKKEIALTHKNYNPYKIYAKTKYTKKESTNTNKKFLTQKNIINISTQKNIKINQIDFEKIASGMKVKHRNFGEGTVLSISGEENNKRATVFFKNIGQKQLLLRFAKLEILNLKITSKLS